MSRLRSTTPPKSLFMMLIGTFGSRIFAQVTRVPLNKLLPAVALLCITGVWRRVRVASRAG
ncbi:MAG: hypothetical protein ACM3TT_11610 [Syntrophothermus sp.]